MPYQKKDSKVSKEILNSGKNIDSVDTLAETTDIKVSDLQQKEDELTKKLEEVKEQKLKVTALPPVSNKSIAELIREQRVLREANKDRSLEDAIKREAIRKINMSKRPGSSIYNPIIMGSSNKA